MTFEKILLVALKSFCVGLGAFIGKKAWETVMSQFEEKVKEEKA